MIHPINTAGSVKATVGSGSVMFGLTMVAPGASARSQLYEFISNTASWVKQGTSLKLTCVAKASLAAGDQFVVSVDGQPFTFAYDISGSDKLPTGVVRVDVSGVSTAIAVAGVTRTAILTKFATPPLAITDNGDGTLSLLATGVYMAITESVVNAGFTIATDTLLVASPASGSALEPASAVRYFDPKFGAHLAVIQDAAGGSASLTPTIGR